MATPTFRRRLARFLRFNLRSALVLVTLLSVLLAWSAGDLHQSWRRMRLSSAVERLGGGVVTVDNVEPRLSLGNWLAGLWDGQATRPIYSIALHGRHVTDGDVVRLVPLLRDNRETLAVDLSLTAVGDAAVEQLATCPHLLSLNLAHTDITEACEQSLQRLRNLAIIDLSYTAAGDQVLLATQEMPALAILRMIKSPVTDDALRTAQHWPKLNEIDLRETPVTDAGVRVLERRMPGLRFLVLTGGTSSAQHDPVMPISASVRFADPFYDDGSLERLKDKPHVEFLDLRTSRVTGAGLSQLPIGDQIHTLHLEGTPVDDQALAALASWRSLKVLHLNGLPITDAGLAHLEELPQLEVLWLNGTSITDQGLKHLGSLRGLQQLYLGNTRIDGTGLSHLAGLYNLRHLLLSATDVSDETLCNLPSLPSLSALDLENTAVTDAGIACLLRFPRLNWISHRGTSITRFRSSPHIRRIAERSVLNGGPVHVPAVMPAPPLSGSQ